MLPSEHQISPSVGHTFDISGRVDFYINDDLKWMIELTREGSKLKEHIARFTPGGIYYDMSSKVNYWVILDFRHNSPSREKMEEGIWYIIYDNNFTEFTILHKNDSNQDGYDKITITISS